MLTREELDKYCAGKSFYLSRYADKVIAAVNRRNGNCPCRKEEVPCPCPMHEKEIEDTGACHCNLFVRKEM